MGNTKKAKRIKQLTNIPIWPSVVALFGNLFIMLIAMIFFSVIIISISADNLFAIKYEDMQKLSENFSKIAEQQYNYEDSINKMENEWSNISAIHMYDRKNRKIYGIGDELSKKDILFVMNLFGDYKLIVDRSFFKEVSKYFDFKKQSGIPVEMDDVVYEHPVWLQTKNLGKNREYFRFCTEMVLVYRIFIFVVLIFLVMCLTTFVPFVFLCANVCRNANLNRRMRHVLFTDVETGGNNWIYFEEKSRHLLKIHKSKTYALVDVELMGYTNYATFHSPDECQNLLEKTYKLLRKKILNTKYETIAHISKADFVMLLKVDDVKNIENRIRNLISFPDNNDKLCLHAGIYLINGGQTYRQRKALDVEVLYNNASMATRSINGRIDSAVMLFNKEMMEQQLWEHKVIEKIDKAIADNEFKVFLQPKYNPVTQKLSGAEALIRWVNEEDGFIGPGKFIPIYEKNGLITKIDDFMLDNTARLQADWLKKGYKIVPVSVNVSRAHFAQENLAEHICEIVDKYDLPHNFIEIELTESAFFDDKDKLLNIVNEIKEYGFDVSMDDFGAGYSSLNSLKDLPLDVLKIDAEFFRGNYEEKRAKIVVSDVISLARHLKMRVVAEGVEKKEQVDFLAGLGCDMIQGFYFSKPVPAEEYVKKMGE